MRTLLFACTFALSVSLMSAAFAQDAMPAPEAVAPSAEGQTVTGSVQMTQQAPAAPTLSAVDYLEIKTAPGEAKYNFKEYTLTLSNKQPKHLELLQLEVMNGMNEEAYLMMKEEKSRAKRRMAGGILRGVTSIGTSFIPYAGGIGSLAAYHAVNAGTNAAYTMANVVENSGGGAASSISGRIVQRANNVMMTPNEQFQFQAVVPENQSPMVRVIFKDLQTNQIYDIQK